MKTRDSGTPTEEYWATFFDPEGALIALGLDRVRGRIIDAGCGYGTFTLPAARLSSQPVLAIDIEPELVAAVERRERADRLTITAVARAMSPPPVWAKPMARPRSS